MDHPAKSLALIIGGLGLPQEWILAIAPACPKGAALGIACHTQTVVSGGPQH